MQFDGEPFLTFLRWFDYQCTVILPDIEPQKVKSLADVCYQCLFFG